MNRPLTVAGAFGLGSGLMYLLDPDRGRRRRALIRDKTVSAVNRLDSAVGKTACDISNRARGAVAEARSLVSGERVPDQVLEARIHSRIGRVISHPGAVDLGVENGYVTLSGPILQEEADDLVRCVRSIRGVTGVENRLSPHEEGADIPGLQGESKAAGERFELMQANWSPTARLFVGVAGGALALRGFKRGDRFSRTIGLVGLGMLTRSITNMELKRLAGFEGERGVIDVQKTITIAAPVETVFEFVSNYDNLPRFMSHLREVRDEGQRRSHWIAAGPAGVAAEWNAHMTQFVPNQVLAWKSVPGSRVRTAGKVRFDRTSDNTTRLNVRLSYTPPAGGLGHAVAKLFGADPKTALDDDLARLKSLIEFGKTTAHAQTVTSKELK